MELGGLKLESEVYKFSPNLSDPRWNISVSIDESNNKYWGDMGLKTRYEISRGVIGAIDSEIGRHRNFEYLDIRDSDNLFGNLRRLFYRYSRKFCFTDSITSHLLYISVIEGIPEINFLSDRSESTDSLNYHFSLGGVKLFYFHEFNTPETLIFHDGIEYNIMNPRTLMSGDFYREMGDTTIVYVLGDRFECGVSARLINPIKIGLVSSNDSDTLKDPDYINWMRIEKLKNLI